MNAKIKFRSMKITNEYLIILSFLIFVLPGCKGEGSDEPRPIPDTTKPTISIIKPSAGQSFDPGSTITFQANFRDNELLKSYEIAVSKVVTSGFTLKNVPVSVPFGYTKSSTNFSSGVSPQEINLSDIVIPANTVTTITTPGNYNFKVTCVDGSNNSAEQTVVISIN